MRGRLAVALVAALTLAACAAPAPVGNGTLERVRKTDTKEPNSSDPATESGVQRLARGPVSTGWRVSRIVDGDTVDVTRGGRNVTLRLIGIDTPETVHPTEPIECFGPEATLFAERRLLGESVALEFDRSQGRLDYYGRTLAYLWTTRGKPRQFNLDTVRRGYALEYTYDDPYLWQREFQRSESLARSAGLGVWGCADPGS
ncbi:MAG: thermonuclease family protein [Actinomycetes bacterium]